MESAVYQLQRAPPLAVMIISAGGQGVHIFFTICLHVPVNMPLIVRCVWGGGACGAQPPPAMQLREALFNVAIHARLLFLSACARVLVSTVFCVAMVTLCAVVATIVYLFNA